MKLERMEEAFLFDGLRSRIEYLKNIYEGDRQAEISGKAPDKTPLERSHVAAGLIIELERLIRTVGKTFEIRDIKILLEEVNELKKYIAPSLMEEKEAEEKKWLEKKPERVANIL